MAERGKLGGTVFMLLAAALAAGIINVSYEVSRDRIAANQRERLLASLRDVLGPTRFDNDLETSRRSLTAPDQLGRDRPVEVFVATTAGRPAAAVFSVAAPHGYSGPIDLLIGIAYDGRITGVRVVSHRETPGLGDAIELRKSDWIKGFDGTSLGAPPLAAWKVAKDGGYFDAITGATVTPRAVIETVRDTLTYFRDHRSELFGAELEETDRGNR